MYGALVYLLITTFSFLSVLTKTTPKLIIGAVRVMGVSNSDCSLAKYRDSKLRSFAAI
jgi:hypothetical protein